MRDGSGDNQRSTRNPKAQRELKRLQWGFHANAVQINNDPGTPRNMREALKGPEAEQWRQGLYEEYDNFFKKRSAWKFQKLPKGKRVIGTKNVLKKTFNDPKANGGTRYKLRNVLLGYQQIPGVDFSESHSPTPRDSSIRMALALALYFGHEYDEAMLEEGDEWVYTNVIDVEAAFLESKLAFPMYIKYPEYFEEYCEARDVKIPEDADCLEVVMSQYGSCHASRDWFNLAVEIYTSKGEGRVELQQSVSDPCIFYKRDAKGRVVLIGSNWVDDSVWSGKRSEIELLKKTMRERVTISDLGPIDTHLGVDYKLCEDADGKYFECSMESYLSDAVKKFEELTGKEVRNYATPGRAHTCLEKYDGDPVNQEEYRSHVGKILFAIKKVLPDCANAIRELSSHLQCPSKEHWLALARLFGYIKHRRRPFKLRQPKELRLVGCSDSDWAGDKNDRHSVTSNITTIGGNSVTEVISKKQTTIATSSAHAETVAGSTLAMEMKAQSILLGEIIGKDPEYPSVMYVDNKAVLFNAENHHVGTGLKHIEIRDRYMLGQTRPREDDGVIELNVRYIATTENVADINTKNLSKETHGKHAEALYSGKFPWNEDFPWISSEEGVERNGQTAYSVESLGVSAGAHSRPSKILDSDWSVFGRSQNQNPDPNPVDICFLGEPDRLGFCDNDEWIPVKGKRRRSTRSPVSSTLQYSDTGALSRRNVNHWKGEVTCEMTSLNGPTDAGIPRRKHLATKNVCGKQSLSESAMMNQSVTEEKSRKCELLGKSELG
jgi:hypothetical protein